MTTKTGSVTAIVQARMGSTRLPNKVMLSLHGSPVIEWVCRRTARAALIDDLIVATSTDPKNDALEMHLSRIGIKVFRGSEDDVLGRYLEAASYFNAGHIVRVCADNPLICPEALDLLVDYYLNSECDYAYNNSVRRGLGAEIASYEVMKAMENEAELQEHREHIFNYLYANPDRFIMKESPALEEERVYPDLSVHLDTYDDYARLLSKDLRMDMKAAEIAEAFK